MKGLITEGLLNELTGKGKKLKKNILSSLTVVSEQEMEKLLELYNAQNSDLVVTDVNCPSPKFVCEKIQEIHSNKQLGGLRKLRTALKNHITEEVIKNHPGYVRACNKQEINSLIPKLLGSVGEIIKYKDKSGADRFGLVFSFAFNNKNARHIKQNGKQVLNPKFDDHDSNVFAYVIPVDEAGLSEIKSTGVTCRNYTLASKEEVSKIVATMELK